MTGKWRLAATGAILLFVGPVAIGVIAGYIFSGGDDTLIHNTDVSTVRGQMEAVDDGAIILPEDGMYQEVRIDMVCVPRGPIGGVGLAVARTPGSVTPVSIVKIGMCR